CRQPGARLVESLKGAAEDGGTRWGQVRSTRRGRRHEVAETGHHGSPMISCNIARSSAGMKSTPILSAIDITNRFNKATSSRATRQIRLISSFGSELSRNG